MQRFWEKTAERDGCLVWTGNTVPQGYGMFRMGSKKRRAHRVAWELAVGPIPEGLWVLHRCDNPGCVRPEHLFLGTASDNAQDRENKGRGNRLIGPWNAAKTHCPRDHEYSVENTRVYDGRRWCRACERDRKRR